MKISIALETEETGEPIEFANAIIKYVMGREYYHFKTNKNELEEMTEHIQVYLKHCEVEGE